MKAAAPGPQGENQPRDILAGLAVAPRELLATCLALFDDAALLQQLHALWGKVKAAGSNVSAVLGEVDGRGRYWLAARYPDEALRLILWSRVRDGFGLQAKLCISEAAELTSMARVMERRPELRERVTERLYVAADATKRGWVTAMAITGAIWTALPSKSGNR